MKLGGKTIVVVEDDWLLRIEIVDVLQEQGFHVRDFSSGEGAVAFLAEGVAVDILITNIQLGGQLSGWDVAEAYRSVQDRLPVIYVSGNPVNPDRRVPDSLFFCKPYSAESILKACSGLN